jgi:superfamily II DNA helicase RecQ
MVPLHGLGSDQVDKSTLREKGVNAYYIDQHKRANEAALRRRLEQLSIDEAKASCTILFVSPQVLAPDSAWFALFESMAKRDLFSLFCIDEAHSVHQDGRAFRVQFNDAVKGIQTLHSLQSQSAPRLIMSATLRPEDQNYVTNLLGQTKPVEMMGDLSRRETRFSVFITGRASSSLYRSAAKDMEQFTEAQQIWYSNSAMSAEEVMVPKADELLQKYVHPTGKESVAMSFTGSDGLILKTALMSAFTNFLSLTAGPVVHDDGTVSLPCIQILVGTQSINAGVSSNFVKFVKQKDLPRNIYDLVQELGRANRLLVDDNCSFEVHLDFKSSTRLFLSCMSNADPSERNITWEMALEVLSFLVTPSACYHYFIERHFNPNSNPSSTCNNCSVCLGESSHYTGLLHKAQLQSFLTTNFLTGFDILASDLLAKIRAAKQVLFHEEHVPGDLDATPIHALGLQLIASRILVLSRSMARRDMSCSR